MDDMFEALLEMFVDTRAQVLANLDAQITLMRETPSLNQPEAIELLCRFRMECDEMIATKIESVKTRALL